MKLVYQSKTFEEMVVQHLLMGKNMRRQIATLLTFIIVDQRKLIWSYFNTICHHECNNNFIGYLNGADQKNRQGAQ
jgi:hypothetical protein